MPRQATPLYIADLSAFTKSLRAALEAGEMPGHAAFMDRIAKAAGYSNVQALKAKAEPPAPSPRLKKALAVFDNEGRMIRWPKQTSVQGLCLWAFWRRLPPRQDMSEAALNEILKAGETFGDHVLLRRSLIDHGLAERALDGSVYRRIEQAPPEDARALLAALP